ncbi:hypothetical protein E2C01_022622 [Portunus trituberculatus]|uniref:Uncharacterized protein n=1 Tax=Portunus trituberculatus TaxID=210409 RepID=A0A5B7E8E4_PORTR|nr:hypothetical protein [Portunus trituberculatus]
MYRLESKSRTTVKSLSVAEECLATFTELIQPYNSKNAPGHWAQLTHPILSSCEVLCGLCTA